MDSAVLYPNLAVALKENKNLKALELFESKFGHSRGRLIFEVLKKNDTLQRINLDGTNIDTEYLPLMLNKNRTLRWLNLRRCTLNFNPELLVDAFKNGPQVNLTLEALFLDRKYRDLGESINAARTKALNLVWNDFSINVSNGDIKLRSFLGIYLKIFNPDLKHLVINKELLEQKVAEHNPPFIVAVMQKKYLLAATMIDDYKVDVDCCNILGYTALHFAIAKADMETIEWLLRRKANLNITSRGRSALTLAQTKTVHTKDGKQTSLYRWLLDNDGKLQEEASVSKNPRLPLLEPGIMRNIKRCFMPKNRLAIS